MSERPKELVDDEGFPITHAFQPMRTAEILQLRREPLPFTVEGLVREKGSTVFLVDQRIDTRYFAIHLALVAASGARLEPFGRGVGAPALLCMPDGDPFDDSRTFSALFANLGASHQRALVESNFRWCHGAAAGTSLPQLNTSSGQAALRNSLPPGCRLLVLVNPGRYLAETPDPMNKAHLDPLIAKLNKEGIAVAIIEPATRPNAAGSVYIGVHHDLVRLSLDAAAPVDFGAGFAMTRPRTLAAGMPTTLHLWYRENDGLVEAGWDPGIEDRVNMGKQVEIWERQRRVETLLAECKSRGVEVCQKTIAESLNVHPSTITRDIRDVRARLKAQERWRSPPSDTTGAAGSASEPD